MTVGKAKTRFEATEIEVRPRDARRSAITLAPIQPEELADIWPPDNGALEYIPIVHRPVVRSWKHLTGGSNGVLWGLYAGDHPAKEMVGYVTGAIEPGNVFSLGRTITQCRNRGRGIGMLAALGVASFVFDKLSLVAVEAYTLTANQPARISLARAGFVGLPHGMSHEAYAYGQAGEGSSSTYSMHVAFAPGCSVAQLPQFYKAEAHMVEKSQRNYAIARIAVDIVYR
ncbi:MAG TPA: GNAT family protein [Candidatus Saccharimonadales bacterium]|nr:GNAT family protein [Candidatus Saccharimonadales bacterium]